MNTTSELNDKKVPELHKLVKATGVAYKVYSKMKKSEMVTHLVANSEKVNIDLAPKPDPRAKIKQKITDGVEEFLADGGKIEVCPGVGDPKITPTNERTALLSPKKKKKGSIKKDKTSTAKNQTETPNDGITLKSIIEELGIIGTAARKALRGSDIQKPGKQWVWEKGHDDIQRVRDLLESV